MPSDTYDIAYVRGFCESLAKRVGELEERVTALDDPTARHVVRGFPDNEWGVSQGLKPSPTDSGRIVVDANEFERLQRIERTAFEYVLEFEAFELNSDQTRLKIFNRKFEELREALKR